MLLFAESGDTGMIAVISVVSGLVGSAIPWLWNKFSEKEETKRLRKEKDEKTLVDHLNAVEKRCNDEREELKEEQKQDKKLILRIISHLTYLEGILENRGIRFRKFDVEKGYAADTDIHTPMPKDKNAPINSNNQANDKSGEHHAT